MMQFQKSPPTVQMHQICKRFENVEANKRIDLDLRAGEIHALLGENGAGKSTLMNILAGWHQADSGEIIIRGRLADIYSPSDAIQLGIGMVHQHFRLVEEMTVAENIFLGWRKTPWLTTKTSLSRPVKGVAEELDYSIDANAKIWQLCVGEQQRVEIMRLLIRGAEILILDEPTAVLTPQESTALFRALQKLASTGKSIVFISHKLDEVLEISDRVTVLRNGEVVGTSITSECDFRILASLMVGQEVNLRNYKKEGSAGSVLLEINDLQAMGDRGLLALKGLSLSVHEREILGIAGVAGNGQSELAEVLTGIRPKLGGSIAINGNTQKTMEPRQLAEAGIGNIPEDRVGIGLFSSLSITHNAILRSYHRPPIKKGTKIDWKKAIEFTNRLIQRGNIKAGSIQSPVSELSGGNQQKLVAHREIENASRVLIAMHPTRGLDFVAADDIRRELVHYRNQDRAILLISEDLDEIFELSDRIAVIFDGRILSVIDQKTASRTDIGLLMGGVKTERRINPA